MKYLSVLLILSSFLLSGCYDSAYNPDYIISDSTAEKEAAEEKPQD